jgi:hypothetical protein
MGGISLVAPTQLCHRVGADWAGQPLWARDLVVEPARQVRWPRQASGGLQQGRSGGEWAGVKPRWAWWVGVEMGCGAGDTPGCWGLSRETSPFLNGETVLTNKALHEHL